MNLFVFDQQTHKIQVSLEFWIYVAAFVPLTMLTLGIWFFLSRSAKQRRERREKSMHAAQIAVQ
jgi:preprotein translocase subunit YajC